MPTCRPFARIVLTRLIAAALCTINVSVYAQAPAAMLPGKAECGAKPAFPGRLASDNQRRSWQKEANEYLTCHKKHVLAKQQAAEDMAKAANDAIDEYNATVKEFEAAAKAE